MSDYDWASHRGPLTVGALREILRNVPDDALLILAKDAEGNSFSPAHDWTPAATYEPDSDDSGRIGNEGDSGDRCVVLWPTN